MLEYSEQGHSGRDRIGRVLRRGLEVRGEWDSTMSSLWDRRSLAVSRSYWVCSPIQKVGAVSEESSQ